MPKSTQIQINEYKQVIDELYIDEREDILEKLTIDILSRCWERMQKIKTVDRPIDYLKESVINEVEKNE